MIGQRFVEADQKMLRQILDALGLAVTFDIAMACIDGPERIRDLAADQLVVGVAGAEGDVRLSFDRSR